MGIPYRIVDIVSGAMNDAAAKKYDIEVKQQILHTKFNLYYYNYIYIWTT